MEAKRILIAGEGGQGIQTIAKLLVETGFKSGQKVVYLPNFGVEQRGGVSLAFVQLSKKDIYFPKFKEADIVVILAARAIKRISSYITPTSLIIFDNSLIDEKLLADFKTEKLAIPASYIAKGKLSPKVFNMVIFGAILEELGGFKEKLAKETVEKFFKEKAKKAAQIKHLNWRALELGISTVKELKKGR